MTQDHPAAGAPRSDPAAMPDADGSPYWKRNLWVALSGSFATIIGMTVMLPFLPLYVEELGEHDLAGVALWSGIAYGATFFAAAFVAPFWGRLGDLYGRKLMLVRASLGMTVAIGLMGMVGSVWQLVALRLFTGLAGGYASGSMVLVATQTPKARSGFALGLLSSGIMAGSLVGPLVGGVLPPLIGIRATFLLAGFVIFLAFLATVFLIKEEKKPKADRAQARAKARASGGFRTVSGNRPVIAMLATSVLLMFATMSIEPIITVYVRSLVIEDGSVIFMSGLVMAASALGSVVSASWLGKLSDRIGHWPVIAAALIAAAALSVPQGFVANVWQLMALRFLMGLALGGLLPCISAVIRHSVPEGSAGAVLGLSVSAQFIGQVAGPVVGGFVGGHIGMPAVFLATALLLALGAGFVWRAKA